MTGQGRTFKRSAGIIMMMSLGLMGCGENTPTFSALADSKIFEQSGTEVNVKIDVLWVIDNSGSMQTSQENLTNNFQSFINDFQVQGFDFQIGVTTTEAYREVVSGVNGISDLRDDSGIQIITPATANINDVFLQNALQGTSGSGDERAFSSFTAALGNTNNASFRRDDAFLAIIIVSDEDDFSHDGGTFLGGQYSDPALHTVESYVDELDTLTNSTEASRGYSVNAIAIWDETCRSNLEDEFAGRLIGQRYGELVDATGGVKGDLCGSFAQSLSSIANSIIRLSTQFYLDREPIPSSIRIVIDGVSVPEASGSSNGGWEYLAESNSVVFSGDFIPAQGSIIRVDFDPANLVN